MATSNFVAEPPVDLDTIDDKDVESITKLQANIRGRKARKEKLEQTEAVNKIAAIQRGRKARKEKQEQTEAVNKIAAIQRGRKARKEKQEQTEAVNKIAAIQRGRKTRKIKKQQEQANQAIESLDLNENDVESITKLQANIRGRKARKEKQEQTEAVNKIAAIQRGRKARKEKQEQTEAVNKIAAIQRGRKARKEITMMQNTTNNDNESDVNENHSKKHPFKVGQRVRARFAGKGHFYNGNITADNGNGTYGIEYDDGDWEDELNGDFIQAIEKKGAPQKANIIDQEQQFIVNNVDPKDIVKENSMNATNISNAKEKQNIIEEYQKLGYGLTKANTTSSNQPEISDTNNKNAFQVGQRVRARFAGKGHLYNGKITADNGNGTYGIEYDDGDWEDELNGDFIQPIKQKQIVNPTFVNGKMHEEAGKIVANVLENVGNNTNVAKRNNIEFSKTWDAGKIPIVLKEEQEQVQNKQNDKYGTFSGAGNVSDQEIAPNDDDDDDDFLRPKSRRGRAKPIEPTGRYPWQKQGSEENEEELEDEASHVRFVDTQSPPKPEKTPSSSSLSPNRKQRKNKRSVSPIHRLSATNLDSFVERNRRAVAYNPTNIKPKPPPPPPPAEQNDKDNDANDSGKSGIKSKRYSQIPPWSTSVKPDTFNVKAKQDAQIVKGSRSPKRPSKKKETQHFLKKYGPSRAEIITTSRYSNKKVMTTSPIRKSVSPVRRRGRPSTAPSSGGNSKTVKRPPGMIGSDVLNAQYLFACKMMEEKVSKNPTEVKSVSTLANRIKEPRLSRMYKREAELFDELAMSSRKALKSLSALQRDHEKLSDAENALKKEIEELHNDVKLDTEKKYEDAKRLNEKSNNNDDDNTSTGFSTSKSNTVEWEVESLCRRAKMKILKRELGNSYERYATELTLLFRRFRDTLSHPSTKTRTSFLYDDLEAYLKSEARRQDRERKHRERERMKRSKPFSINLSGKIKENQKSNNDYGNENVYNISGTSLLKALYLFAEDVVKQLTGHEKAILLAHFDTDGKSTVDVDEFMDSLRPALNEYRQDIVDGIFKLFQNSKASQSLQQKANEVNLEDVRLPQIDLIDGKDVWSAYSAYREMILPGDPKGHSALLVFDHYINPKSVEKAEKDGYPAIAMQALNRDEWEALHRAVSMRVPNNKVFKKLMKSVWIFAEDVANDRGNDNFNDKNTRKQIINDMEVPVTTSEKIWEEYSHEQDGITKPYWYCVETGETVWKMPNVIKESMILEAKRRAIKRKMEAIRLLDIAKNDIDNRLDIVQGRFEVPGIESYPLAISELDITDVPSLLSNRRFTHMHLDGNNFGRDDETCSKLDAWLEGANNLKELSLCRNNLRWLPTGGKDATAFRNLRILRANRNFLKTFPHPPTYRNNGNYGGNTIDEAVSNDIQNNFALLSTVDLSENQLIEISPSINLCKSMCELNLSGNQLPVLPNEIGALGSLISLNLSHNRLKQLPDSINGLAKLQRLDVRENRLEALPSILNGLVALETLYLSKNLIGKRDPIGSLPKSFCSLSNLITCDLSSNQLKRLPKKIGKLAMLKRLDLHQNQINDVPQSVYYLNALEEVYFNNNQLEYLPNPPQGKECWKSIKVLCLQKNALKALNGEVLSCIGETLVSLKLHGNQIDELPEEIGHLVRLEQLHLANNNINVLPAAFGKLKALNDLTLLYNPNLSQGLAQVVRTGNFVSAEEVQLRRCTSNLFDAIRTRWPELKERLKRAKRKANKIGHARGRMPNDDSKGGNVAKKIAMAETIGESGLGGGTTSTSGKITRKKKSLSVSYRRLRDALYEFDSDRGGRLSNSEFSIAIAALGLFLSDDDCDMLTVYAINRCTDRSLNKISIDAFVHALHQPQSTIGGVAQSVVRYCEASALRKASLNEQKSSKRRGRSSVEKELEMKKERLLNKNRELEAANRVKERKAHAIRMYLDGRGPDPEGNSTNVGGDQDFKNVIIEIDENGLPKRDRLVIKRAENDRLEKQRKFLENEIRRKNAEVRRLEREAELERQRIASENVGSSMAIDTGGGSNDTSRSLRSRPRTASSVDAKRLESERLRKMKKQLLQGDDDDNKDLIVKISSESKNRTRKKVKSKQAQEQRRKDLEEKRQMALEERKKQEERLKKKQDEERALRERREKDLNTYAMKKKAMRDFNNDASTSTTAKKKKKKTKRSNGVGSFGTTDKGNVEKTLPMRVTMMIMGSRAAPFSVVLAPDETISDLKAKVEFREGIPAKKQTLFHRQKRLEDNKMTVRKAKFKGGDTIHIVLHKVDN